MSNHGQRASPPATPSRAGKAYLGWAGLANRRDTKAVLLARVAGINLLGVAFVVWAWSEGLVAMVVAADPTYQCAGIAAVFTVGLGFALQSAWRIGSELDATHAGTIAETARNGMERRLRVRLRLIRHYATTLVILGLLGTVIGFIVALQGVKADAIRDAATIGPMVAGLISGMGIALYTTLVGAVLNIWLTANYQALYTAAEKLLACLERDDGRA